MIDAGVAISAAITILRAQRKLALDCSVSGWCLHAFSVHTELPTKFRNPNGSFALAGYSCLQLRVAGTGFRTSDTTPLTPDRGLGVALSQFGRRNARLAAILGQHSGC